MLRLRKLPLLIGVGLALAMTLIGMPRAIAQESERVGLVIQFADDSLLTMCIDTGGQALSGLDILELSGVDLAQYYDANRDVAVCSINGQGCDANHCFCEFPDYWSYWHTEIGDWVYSGRGASTYVVQPGTVEGWRWGSGVPPSVISFDEICLSDPQQATPEPGILKPLDLDVEALPSAAMAGMLPAGGAASQQAGQQASQLTSAGFIIFGVAMLVMGLGLIFIVQLRQR